MPTDDTSRDQPGHVATGRDTVYALTIEDAAALYERAGHPRTPRSIQRYCASGHLDAIKETTMLGDKYFIDPASVARHIAQIEELIALDQRTTGRDTSRPVVPASVPQPADDNARQEPATELVASQPVAPAQAQLPPAAETGDSARQSAPESPNLSRPVATVSADTSRLVAGLEREVERGLEDRQFLKEQIKVKDEQIAALLERDRETNILVRGLQQMLSPLLGAPRQDDRPPFH
jgi:hypothetical protein